jgi:two-component system sensor histidine kinase UhpB
VKETDGRFRRLVENAQDVIYLLQLHPVRRYDYLSPAVLQLTGHTRDEFYAQPDLAVTSLHPDDQHLAAASYAHHRRGQEERVLLRWIHPGGRIVYAEHHRIPVFDAGGRLVAVEGIGRDVTERILTERRLRESEDQLRRLAGSLQSSREEERAHLARELHDELGQTLTGVKLELTRIIRGLIAQHQDRETIDRLQSLTGGIDLATETVRRIATALRPPALDHLGLVAAIELEAAAIARRSGLRCRVVGAEAVTRLTAEQATAVFRIIQEALTNIVRHADARAATISIRETNRSMTVRIRDNGRGISADAIRDPKSIGLLGMRERAGLVGATVTIAAAPGGGTSIVVRIPRPGPPPQGTAR